ncbi:heme o synthase [Spiribacter vilamensis]|uniref:Protoheme IX farnesyltransferase n=1 Tax=Spiribacter vilamensis TaxID=531306 RepID=A0A4Q8D1T5_9GAMM|nr:heme o synthase [Spiribacter vilamensis]RZU99237.1 protoheme IX farnesyltransferase [Spiribacter vilamensis]TVO61776.1 protoheme IX farnesyltransferase [Spiribacter vilamensis]
MSRILDATTNPSSGVAALAQHTLQRWHDYYELTKPGVVALMVFTAVVGELLASPGAIPWMALTVGNIGIALAAGSAAAINHLVDRRIDARMKRTRGRPLPTGGLRTSHASLFAGVLGLAGLSLLYFLVNPLTAWLTFGSLIGYAFIYTLFLKRATPQNIVIGGAAGAAPPVLGWVAVTGSIDPHALLLFLIIFTWTPPHFWALAIHRREEYASVDIPMLPVTHGDRFTRWQILFYTVMLVGVTLLPFATGMSGPVYLAGALILGGRYLWFGYALLARPDDQSLPMRSFGFSIVYLMALFAVLLVDAYLPVVWGLLAG